MGVTRGTPAARQRTTAVLTAVVAAAIVIGILVVASRAPGPGRDSRAYPADRGTITLAGALGRAHVRIPDCLAGTLRYAVPGPSHDLYLMLNGSRPCLDQFTTINALTSEGATAELPAWAVDGRGETLGWRLDASRGYTLYTARPAPDHTIEALIRELSDASAYQAFVRAT
ncbi:hypothetical protein J2S43_003279 [Catenuloplanes nepalensis]|uniref:Uncharacterized protein n=1 Tax=Catenuloplanes nepalensis TaxID=587533 RepID=A0ABT9MTJ7_9ACTN|nr:hypothetical protein [Catenuloplanes nepalensis]MDP9794767.1 hypothetical protein [Catenuloplanes nepalensis]